jgi:hypothetical protein
LQNFVVIFGVVYLLVSESYNLLQQYAIMFISVCSTMSWSHG